MVCFNLSVVGSSPTGGANPQDEVAQWFVSYDVVGGQVWLRLFAENANQYRDNVVLRGRDLELEGCYEDSTLSHIVVMPSRAVLVACVLAVTEEQRHVRGADAMSPYLLQHADNPVSLRGSCRPRESWSLTGRRCR